MKSQNIRPLGVFETSSNDESLQSNAFEKQAIGDGAFTFVKKEESLPALDVNRYAKFTSTWTKPKNAA
ncbi:MAG: hypothetical protein HYR85_23675 [Planctomycetes bacterium]|nr:hypothetical protein [Planctomycetota bacterium]MBI3844056.1 hypothetical protein [Planctomycetota bacterium]